MAIVAATIGAAQTPSSVSSLTFAHTVAAGADRLLTLVVGGANTTQFSITATYGGVDVPFVDFGRTSNSAQKVFLLRQIAPAVGTANVVINLVDTMGSVAAQAVTWTGVDQVTPMGSTATVQNSGTQASGSLTGISSALNDVILDGIITGTGLQQTLVQDAAQTLLFQAPGAARAAGSSYKPASAGTSSTSWSWQDAGNWGILGVALKPGASGPAPQVAAVTPASGFTTGGEVVAITGFDFQDGATVTIGGASATSVAFVSENTLTAVTPAGVEGARDVVVTNPDEQSDTLTGGFTYIPVDPVYLDMYIDRVRLVVTGSAKEADGMKIERVRRIDLYVEKSRTVSVEFL